MNERVAKQALELVENIERKREEQKPLLRKLRMWAELALQGYTYEQVDHLGTDPERVKRLIRDYERAIRIEARRIAKGQGVSYHVPKHVKQARENIPRPVWMTGADARFASIKGRRYYTKVMVDGAWEDLDVPVRLSLIHI